MQNKTAYTDFILTELNKGNVKYNDVCSVFCSKFRLSERSFDKYWKLANVTYSEQRTAIDKERLSTTIEIEKEAVKTLILDKVARMKIAEEIAIGKAKRVEGQIVMPSFTERMRALDYLSKIEGDYAPERKEIKSENVDIDLSKLNKDELRSYLDLEKKALGLDDDEQD
jgi:hypothetical protein